MSHRAFVGLGANLGDPVAQIRAALKALAPVRVSSLYRTEPLGDPGQPWYVNAVCEIRTSEPPLELLGRLRALERNAGRPAERPRWAPRLLDLDLLLYEDQVLETPELTLPHPGLAERRFVLEPLAELDPDVRDPRTGRTARDLLGALDDVGRVEKLPGLHGDAPTDAPPGRVQE